MTTDSLKEEFPFALYADEKYPLLRIAAADQSPAHSIQIEWLVDNPKREVWKNYQQIVRTPFKQGESERNKWRALDNHLQTVEQILWDGVPQSGARDSDQPGYYTCGGVRHYLGRDPLYADRIFLKTMRDLVLLRDRAAGDDGREPEDRTHEFLSEFSLGVFPAHSIPRPR